MRFAAFGMISFAAVPQLTLHLKLTLHRTQN